MNRLLEKSPRSSRGLSNLTRSVLGAVRARPGARAVQVVPDVARGGNLLYLWQWAHIGVNAGYDRHVLAVEKMTPWLAMFPALTELTVPARSLRLVDRREVQTHHAFGTDFTAVDNDRFCRWLLADSPRFDARLRRAQHHVGVETCVINVRRGDYYSDPHWCRLFAIDIRGHVAEAINIAQDRGRWTGDVLVVSDDLDWCAANLGDLLPTGARFAEHRRDLFDDLAAIAVSRTLVLANSTFSYWGSFFAETRTPDHWAIAPAHHQWTDSRGFVDDLFDPRWERTGSRAAGPAPNSTSRTTQQQTNGERS